MGGLAVASIATGGLGGSGTLNRIAKFTPDGDNLGNSLLSDDGTDVTLTSGRLGLPAGTSIGAAALSIGGASTNGVQAYVASKRLVIGIDGLYPGVAIGDDTAAGLYLAGGNWALRFTNTNNDPTGPADSGLARFEPGGLKPTDGSTGGGHVCLQERAAPTGTANYAKLYAVDNGGGKTQLVAIFGSGAAQVLATEP